jgi:hypothetical protein
MDRPIASRIHLCCWILGLGLGQRRLGQDLGARSGEDWRWWVSRGFIEALDSWNGVSFYCLWYEDMIFRLLLWI